MQYIRYKTYQKGGLSNSADNRIHEIIKMYFTKINQNPDNMSSYISELTIENSFDEIKKYYNKYGIIILRNPFKEYIFIGNAPTKIENVITINTNLEKNPTIIGRFGIDEGIIQFYKNAEFRFRGIFTDMKTNKTLPTFYKTFNEIFINDFSSFDINPNKLTYNGTGLKSIENN